MKRVLIAIIVLFVLFAFVGCVDNATDTQTPTDTGIGTIQPEKNDKPSDTENPSDIEQSDDKEITTMYIYINDNKLEVTLDNNSSVDALVEILKTGDITYMANDYGNFEKVGNIGHNLPRNDEQIDTQAGDVILYQGNNICLYYGTNSWSFTRLGKINGYTSAEIRNLLGAGKGSVQVRISLK